MGHDITQYRPYVLESQLDWLSFTTPDSALAAELSRWLSGLSRPLEADGHPLRPFAMEGYRGMHCGPFTWGVREDGGYFAIASEYAAEHFAHTVGLGVKYTRLDPQVTARIEPDTHDWASSAAASAQMHAGRNGRPLVVDRWLSSNGGSTTYVGAASSIYRGRCYYKAVQRPEPRYEHAWRWEVQCRHEAATAIAERLAVADDPAGLIQGFVGAWYSDRGVEVPFDLSTPWLPQLPPRGKTPLDAKLEWLYKSVRPTVEILRDAKRLDQTLKALGLEDLLACGDLPLASDGADGHRITAEDLDGGTNASKPGKDTTTHD